MVKIMSKSESRPKLLCTKNSLHSQIPYLSISSSYFAILSIGFYHSFHQANNLLSQPPLSSVIILPNSHPSPLVSTSSPLPTLTKKNHRVIYNKALSTLKKKNHSDLSVCACTLCLIFCLLREGPGHVLEQKPKTISWFWGQGFEWKPK